MVLKSMNSRAKSWPRGDDNSNLIKDTENTKKNDSQNGPQRVKEICGKFMFGASWASRWDKLGLCSPIWVQVGSKLAPSWPQEASSWPQKGSSWAQVGSKLAWVGILSMKYNNTTRKELQARQIARSALNVI